ERGRAANEEPRHFVTIGHEFAIAMNVVTFAEWDACVNDGGCSGYRPSDNDWGRGDRPVVNVSWEDAQEFVSWLNSRLSRVSPTAKVGVGLYRLPSESEWEYAARAGTTSRFYWSDDIGISHANCNGCGSKWDALNQTSPVGSFLPNAFGLYDMAGNVWQWVQDCYNGDYNGAPTDGSAWTSGDCNVRGIRGGSWVLPPPGPRPPPPPRDAPPPPDHPL